MFYLLEPDDIVDGEDFESEVLAAGTVATQAHTGEGAWGEVFNNETIGRVENSKTFQNQMSQCFFIGLYYIETGDNFYFFKKKFFDRWKCILKKINF